MFDENNKKCQTCLCKQKVVFFNLNYHLLTRDVTCSKCQRSGENIGDKKLSVGHTRKADTDIILNEKSDIIFKNKEIFNKFNEYYKSIAESLGLHI